MIPHSHETRGPLQLAHDNEHKWEIEPPIFSHPASKTQTNFLGQWTQKESRSHGHVDNPDQNAFSPINDSQRQSWEVYITI